MHHRLAGVRTRLRFDRRTALQAGTTMAGALLLPGATPVAAAASTPSEGSPAAMSYHVTGRLLEVCTCNILCPCWVGEDPDYGTCDSSFAWQIEEGTIEGVDVGGLALGLSVHIPGNVLKGNWKVVVYIDDRASKAQEAALLNVWTGKLGGPVADLAALIGEVVTVERAAINFDVNEGKGTLTIGEDVVAELAPFQGVGGTATSLHDTVFSTIPGAPAFVGKASRFFRDNSRHGLSKVEISGQNAIQGLFTFEA